MIEQKKVDVYLDTINRLEPNIGMIDQGAFNASAAISLKRIADAQERIAVAQGHIADLISNPEDCTKNSNLYEILYWALVNSRYVQT